MKLAFSPTFVLLRVQRVIDRTRVLRIPNQHRLLGAILCCRFVVVLKGQLSDKPLLAIEPKIILLSWVSYVISRQKLAFASHF